MYSNIIEYRLQYTEADTRGHKTYNNYNEKNRTIQRIVINLERLAADGRLSKQFTEGAVTVVDRRMQTYVAVHVSGGVHAASVADQSENHLPAVESENRQPRLQLQGVAPVSGGYHLQSESLQVCYVCDVDDIGC